MGEDAGYHADSFSPIGTGRDAGEPNPDGQRHVEPALGPIRARVRMPGCRELTKSALIAAVLASGRSSLLGVAGDTQTRILTEGLKRFGAEIAELEPDEAEQATGDKETAVARVEGGFEKLHASDTVFECGEAGDALIHLAILAGILEGRSVFEFRTGEQSSRLSALVKVLHGLGAEASLVAAPSGNAGGRLTVNGTDLQHVNRRIEIEETFENDDAWQDLVPSLALIGPALPGGISLSLPVPLANDFTGLKFARQAMWSFGATALGSGRAFGVPPRRYESGSVQIEGDAVCAAYAFAGAAIGGGKTTIMDLARNSPQSAIAVLTHFENMGCQAGLDTEDNSLYVSGPANKELSADLTGGQLADLAPLLAVTASFIPGVHRLTGLGSLRDDDNSEFDRLAALVDNLGRLGVVAEESGNSMTVVGGGPTHGATIDPQDDPAIAMSFGVAGLAIPGMEIVNSDCVSQVYPGFWEMLSELARSANETETDDDFPEIPGIDDG